MWVTCESRALDVSQTIAHIERTRSGTLHPHCNLREDEGAEREDLRASFQSHLWHGCLFEAEIERNLPEEQNRRLFSVPYLQMNSLAGV